MLKAIVKAPGLFPVVLLECSWGYLVPYRHKKCLLREIEHILCVFWAQKQQIWPQRLRRPFTRRYDSYLPRCVLSEEVFTPCVTERRAGEIGPSTPVVMPILKIKAKDRQTLCFVSHVWRAAEKCKGKWWDISRWELVGCVTTYLGTALLPFPWKTWNSKRCMNPVWSAACHLYCLLKNIQVSFWWVSRGGNTI